MRHLVVCLILFSWLAGTRAGATCEPITCSDYSPGNPLVSWLDLDWKSTVYYGGTTGEIPAVKGTVIWMAANTHLDSYDASDPRNIRRIKSLPMPNLARHITIAGNLAYTTGQYGLVITDISDPARPVILSSSLHNDLDAAEYKDGYLYAISYERVVVIDVRTPRTPTIVASYLHGRPLLDIGLYGNLILAQDNEGRTLCLAQPSTSSLQQRWLVYTAGIRLAIHGDYFHVTNNFALHTYRLPATGQPTLAASIPLAYGGRVTTIGDVLYVCDLAGFRLFDATTAPALVELNHVRGPWSWARPVALGDYIVATSESDILVVFDPRTRGDSSLSGVLQRPQIQGTLATSGHYAYTAFGDSVGGRRGLAAFDLSDPEAPRLAGEFVTPVNAIKALHARDGYLFTNQLLCLDVSDPANMRYINSVPFGDVSTVGPQLAFTAYQWVNRIEAVDISDPAHPRMVGSIAGGSSPISCLGVEGDILVVGRNAQFSVFDVASPAAMRHLATFDLGIGNDCHSLSVQGSLVFLTLSSGSMKIIDLADPTHPVVLSTFYPPGVTSRQEIVAGNGVVYLSSKLFGVLIVDVTDPSHPFLRGYTPPRQNGWYDTSYLAVTDGLIVTITDHGALQVSPRQCGDVTPLRPVTIDIEPRDACHRVPCGPRAHGRIDVAILSEPGFDATQIAASTLRFGPGGAPELDFPAPDKSRGGRGGRDEHGDRDHHDDGHGHDGDHHPARRHLFDVDCDGDLDFVAHFDARAAAIACGDTFAALTGSTGDGTALCAEGVVSTERQCPQRDHGGKDPALAGKSLRPGDCGGWDTAADKADAGGAVFTSAPVVAPNPFNPETVVSFALGAPLTVEVTVYDLAGRRVADLVRGELAAGEHDLKWDGRDGSGRSCPSGIYLVRVTGEGASVTLRAALLR